MSELSPPPRFQMQRQNQNKVPCMQSTWKEVFSLSDEYLTREALILWLRWEAKMAIVIQLWPIKGWNKDKIWIVINFPLFHTKAWNICTWQSHAKLSLISPPLRLLGLVVSTDCALQRQQLDWKRPKRMRRIKRKDGLINMLWLKTKQHWDRTYFRHHVLVNNLLLI